MSTALTPPTPKNVAEMLTSGDNDYHDGNDWHPSLSAEGNVVSIGITPFGEDSETDLPEVHFRAVVVEGEAVPIVAKRPDLTDMLDCEGGSVEDDDIEGWQALPSIPGGHVIFRGSGRISFAEARRFGAALIALADQGEAETL